MASEMLFKTYFFNELIRPMINKSQMLFLSTIVHQINKEQYQKISIAKLKNPYLCLFLSFFLGLFAVDRFYQGKKAIAFCKLFIFLVSTVALFYTLNYPIEPKALLVVTRLLSVALLFFTFLFYLYDLFIVFSQTQDDNFSKIVKILKVEHLYKDFLQKQGIEL